MTDPTGMIGDYFNFNGVWLGHDGKDDQKVYFARLIEDRGAEVDLDERSIRRTTLAEVSRAQDRAVQLTPGTDDPASALVNAVAEAAPQKIATVGVVAGTAVAVGTGAGVVMAATGTAAGAGITTLGLTQTATGVGATVATVAAANPDKTAQVLQTVLQLPDAVLKNFNRFANKVPANARSNASLDTVGNGGYRFTATSAGNVPGSRAIYEKTVDAAGRTVGYIKTTIAPDGSIVHIKDKLK